MYGNPEIPEKSEVAALTLDEEGNILDCNFAAETLFGYESSELLSRHISLLFPQFGDSSLLDGGKLNPKISFMCHCGHLFRVRDSMSRPLVGELHIVELGNSGMRTFRVIVPVESVMPEIAS